MEPEEYREKLFDIAVGFNKENPGFVAIPAIEWGNTASGNHVNVFGIEQLPPDSIKDKDYDDLFVWAANNAEFIQLNHPYSWGDKDNKNTDVGNFGQGLYASTQVWVDALDPVAKTITLIATVAGGHISGKYAKSTKKTHRDGLKEYWYKRFLNYGFHVSPAANQDTHRKNFGTVTAARTAVWAEDSTYDELMEGFRANRVYATEDDEMAVVFQVRYQGKTYWMGETVPLEDEEQDVEVLVRVWQVAGSDGDSTNEGPYTVELLSDWDGVGDRFATEWDQWEVPQNSLVARTVPAVAGEYFYLRITEQNGKDNPIGDGEDVFVNGTNTHQTDGKRDNMNDNAWTSPVWFVAEE